MDKNELRRFFLKKRNALKEADVQKKSNIIYKKIIDLPVFKESENIFCYIAYKNEVETRSIIEKAVTLEKKLYMPVIKGDNMFFGEFSSFEDLRKGAFGILEPRTIKEVSVLNALVLVPGVGFDRKGNRIGFGKGFYDRYFHNNPTCLKVALAYDFQIAKQEIPSEEHDVLMDFIITEQEVIKTGELK